MFNVELVADLLSVTKQTILDWTKSGRLVSGGKDGNGDPMFEWKAFCGFSQTKDMNKEAWENLNSIRPDRPFRSIE